MIKWGILGLGTMANNFATAIKETSNAKLLAISSLDKNKLSNFSKKFNIDNKYAYNKYEDLLKLNEIDAVYISTLNNTHLDLIVKSAQNKKHILCEKPFVMNFNEAQVAFEHIKKESVFFMEAIAYRSHPQTKEILNIIDNNEIGKINAIESSFGFKAKVRPESRHYNKKLGGGAILDLGCYPVSISQLIASLIPNIDISNFLLINKKKEIGSTDVDIDAYAELQFDNKFTCVIASSFKENLGKKTRIIGKKGEILIENTWHGDPSIIKIKGEKNYEINVKCNENIYSYEIENISKSVLENKKESIYPGMSLIETLLNMKILDEWLND